MTGLRPPLSRDSRQSARDGIYDVIVIGSGMGGCAAGAITARHGLKTLILEKNPTPGGNCSSYLKEGFRVDTGTHLFIRGNKGPFGVLTRRLGMGTPLEFVHTPDTVHLKGMNIDLVVPRALSAILYRFVIPRLLWQARIHPRHYPGIMHLFFDILRMDQRAIEQLDQVSVEDFVARYTDSSEIKVALGLLLGLFFILPPWEASAGESIWNLQKLVREYTLGYPKGGAVKIPQTFLAGARRHGATVRLQTAVQKITIARGQVRGVVLAGGERIAARAVISTTAVKDTIELLAGRRHFPPDYLAAIGRIRPSWTAVQAKIGLKGNLVRAGSLVGGVPLRLKGRLDDSHTRTLIAQLEQGRKPDILPIYCPVPSNYDPHLAPEGCQLLTAVAVAPTLDVALMDDPKIWTDALLDALMRMIPQMEEHIIFCDLWSVETLANWIGKSSGSAVTTGQTPSQVRHLRPPHATPVKGLYLAGDGAGPARGVGTELACKSGMDCGDLVASHIINHVV